MDPVTHLTQGCDGFKTDGIIWNLYFSVQVTVGCQSVCWLLVHSFSEMFIRDYLLVRSVCFLCTQSSSGCSLLHGACPRCCGFTRNASAGLAWVRFPLRLGLVRFSWRCRSTCFQTVNLPKSHTAVSVVLYLVQEVFTCLVFTPTVPRGKEGAGVVLEIGCKGEGTMAWVSLGGSHSSGTAGQWD